MKTSKVLTILSAIVDFVGFDYVDGDFFVDIYPETSTEEIQKVKQVIFQFACLTTGKKKPNDLLKTDYVFTYEEGTVNFKFQEGKNWDDDDEDNWDDDDEDNWDDDDEDNWDDDDEDNWG